MRPVLALAMLALAACSHTPGPVPNPPAPRVIEVPVRIYVPIPPELTARCRWVRSGVLPSAAFEVLEGRKACLIRYEERLKAIEEIQGKPVPGVRLKRWPRP